MTLRTSLCTPPADPGSAVVAHAESSGGACSSSGVTRCHNCGAPVAHYLKFSACTNPECDAPYYQKFQPTLPAPVEPVKPKTILGVDCSKEGNLEFLGYLLPVFGSFLSDVVGLLIGCLLALAFLAFLALAVFLGTSALPHFFGVVA